MGSVVRIADFTVTSPTIEGHTFEDCLLIGPAVLAVTGSSTISDCSFDGEIDALLWELPPTRASIIGAIEARDCVFLRCRFQQIGFTGPTEFVEMFRSALGGSSS